MKKFQGWIILGAVIVSCGVFQWAVAQSGGSAVGTRVAVLDAGKVMNESNAFKAAMDALLKKNQDSKAEFMKRREEMTKLAEKAKLHQQTSPEYAKLEEEAARLKTQYDLDTKKRYIEFMQEEARTYYSTMKTLTQVTETFCQQRGIDVVVRIGSWGNNNTGIDVQRPELVNAYVNRNVIWSSQAIDITPFILAGVNQQAPAGAAAVPASPFSPSAPGYRN